MYFSKGQKVIAVLPVEPQKAANSDYTWIKVWYLNGRTVGWVAFEFLREVEETIESLGTPVKIINDWLRLYDAPTISNHGRTVKIPSGAISSAWYAFEGLRDINKWAKINIENSGRSAVVNIGTKGELTDQIGRYWIAVGPKVMNPEHKNDQGITADEMNYGTMIDVVLQDSNGTIFYFPTVVGETKAHTYPNGVYQTGYTFPNGNEYISNTSNGITDNSVIEFIGLRIPEHGLNSYKIMYLIVYD
jgi:hypothetical protein